MINLFILISVIVYHMIWTTIYFLGSLNVVGDILGFRKMVKIGEPMDQLLLLLGKMDHFQTIACN